MKKFGELADQKTIDRAVQALNRNGIKTIIVGNGEEARKKALELLPADAEVMNMSSVTLDSAGISKEINESGRYNPVRKKFAAMDKATQGSLMQKLGAAPDYAIGSVHAVTENGEVIVVSQTGSQLPAYAFGSGHVIWVVGAQKFVKNIEKGMKRVYEYVLPLENERAMKAYGKGSNVNKILIINKEINPERITMIIVKEKLGF
jgi:hypothetical protein